MTVAANKRVQMCAKALREAFIEHLPDADLREFIAAFGAVFTSTLASSEMSEREQHEVVEFFAEGAHDVIRQRSAI